MLKNLLKKLLHQENLEGEEIKLFIHSITEQPQNTAQIATFLALLKMKGETAKEIAGFAKELKKQSICVTIKTPFLDIVGTGGDGAQTVNISTGSAILAAACGIPVAKHGNRAVSSQCGAADVLQSLGVSIDLDAEEVAKSVEEVGIGFMLASRFYPILQHIAPVRRSLGIPTLFNLLGPLLNPAGASYLLLGVYQKSSVPLMAEALQNLEITRGLIFHGHGTDELTPCSEIDAIEISPDGLKPIKITPQEYGLPKCTLLELRGGEAEKNAYLLRNAFEGKVETPLSNTLALNAGIAIWLYGLAPSPKEGVALARKKLKEGAAEQLLHRWIAFGKSIGRS